MGGQQAKPPAGQADAAGGKDGGFSTTPAKKPTNKVQLAVSQLGGVPGAAAYHSSVIINDEEFFFSDGGISVMGTSGGLASHRNPQKPDSMPTVTDMGMSQYSGSQVKAVLERHFLAGTYDLLRKNCNSFSDCALFYLLHVRLDQSYRKLEKLGARNMGVVQAASGGQYTPNPKCDDFDLEKLIIQIDPETAWATPGQSIGGAPSAGSPEAMRAARLARLGGGGGGSSAGGAGGGGYGGAAAPVASAPAATPVAAAPAGEMAPSVAGSGGI